MVRYIEKEMPVFWGCTFIQSLPFLMDSTRKVFDYLDIELKEVENTSCCPDPTYLPYEEETLLAISARNLALAEKIGKELLVPCNGCYVSLNKAHKKLENPNTKERINNMLKNRYHGNLKVVHILQELYSNLKEIKARVVNPLSNLRVAVHYGCHALYPRVIEDDNPEPKSLDMLVEATGAKSIAYDEKFTCCGVPIMAYDPKKADMLLLNKLKEVKEKADCIVTTCPGCFLRFDMPNPKVEEYKVPVLHLSELLLLSFGVPPDKIFFAGHATDVSPILEKIKKEKDEEYELVKKYFDIDLLKAHCGACSKECTVAIATRNQENPFDPLAIVNKLLEGKFYEVIESKDIWRCLQCGKCEIRCPNNIGLKELFLKLRELSVKHEKVPRVVRDKKRMLEKTGYAMPTKISIRRRMNLPLPKPIEVGEIKEIIEKTSGEKHD